MARWKKLLKFVLPTVAVGSLILAVAHAVYSQRPAPTLAPPVTPATNPFGPVVAGTGFVEPSTESSTQSTIAVGSLLPGVVANVAVHIEQLVEAGDLLFELDKRQSEAELKIRQAAVAAAEAQLSKLEKQPRPEEVPPLEAQVRANQATLRTQLDVRDRDRKLVKSHAVTDEEMVAAEQAAQTAQAQADVSGANLALLKAGAWEPDKVIAAAAVRQAQAQVDQTMTQLALLEIRAPVTGTILQVNVRPGESISASPGQSLIVMGNLQPYHVRVSVDEEDIPRLKLNAPARAKLRGDLQQREVPMQFVRIEPYVIPKTSLTGVNTERVDTRVMQLIYAIDPANPLVREKKVLVGQLLDVFIDVK
jgi:multidrug resistance efflux pump